MVFDTHCHVQFAAYKDDRDEVMKRNLAKGVIMNLVGTHSDTSTTAVALAEQYDNCYASIGVHPNHLFPTHIDEGEWPFLSREESFNLEHFTKLAQSKKVIAVGECGLDLFHLPPDIVKEVVLEKQIAVFVDHLNFAHAHNLPLVIHCRDAHDEMIELLKEQIAKNKEQGTIGQVLSGTIHCFTSNWTHAQKYLDLGFHLGFTGVITYPPKKLNPQTQIDLLTVVKNIPLDRVLVETDAPYLAPIPYRGSRAEPYMVEEVIKTIAEIKGLAYDVVEKATTANAQKLFL